MVHALFERFTEVRRAFELDDGLHVQPVRYHHALARATLQPVHRCIVNVPLTISCKEAWLHLMGHQQHIMQTFAVTLHVVFYREPSRQ